MTLNIQEISKRFRGLEALRNVSFDVPPGQAVGIIGANGAGKTTLFNVISGVIPPDGGSIKIDGRETTRLQPHQICKLGIGRAFQITRPFLGLTCLENVMIGALNRAPSATLARENAMAVLEKVGLQDRTGSLGRDLSVSQRKRLELARAIATEPKVLLLDEVLSGLNDFEVEAMVKLLSEITKSMTILVIEHITQAILDMCSRALFMQAGAILIDGTPEEILNHEIVAESYLGRSDPC
jgi:branched-chain amino acid transport system ATP-binding protein